MASKWRENVADLAGTDTTQRLIARILTGTYAGKILCNVAGTVLAIVPYPPSPGILPTPVFFRALTSTDRFPYGYDVEPDN